MAPPRSRARVEYQSYGPDQQMQLVGSDPFRGRDSLGMKVPTLATQSLPSAVGQGLDSRYLFHLASFQVPPSGGCSRIIGYRLLVELWAVQSTVNGNRVVRQTVYDPGFVLSDANWSWHMRYIPGAGCLENIRGGGGLATPAVQSDGTFVNLDGTAFRMSSQSALLYETLKIPLGDPFYVDLSDYVPPNKGRPWGEPLANMGTFYGVSTNWSSDSAWSSLDIPCVQPGTYALFASVRQTNTATRVNLTAPGTFFSGGLGAEEAFLLNFAGASTPPFIGVVGGSLIVEHDVEECYFEEYGMPKVLQGLCS
jgi:hypothetical protein